MCIRPKRPDTSSYVTFSFAVLHLSHESLMPPAQASRSTTYEPTGTALADRKWVPICSALHHSCPFRPPVALRSILHCGQSVRQVSVGHADREPGSQNAKTRKVECWPNHLMR